MLMLLASSTQSQAQKHEDMNRFVVACALVACAYVAPIPGTDTDIVETTIPTLMLLLLHQRLMLQP